MTAPSTRRGAIPRVLKIRRDDEISDVDGGWFRARWHYSFDTYVDPEYTSFGTMRVFNDDRLVPGAVWPMHPHRDIEGLTYVSRASSATRTMSGVRRDRCPRVRCSG